MEQIDENSMYENVMNECKERRGIIIGIFGNVSWLLDYKHWEWGEFAIVFSTNVAFVSSIAFAFLDVPGSRYLFCSNVDKPFEDVSCEGNIHVQVYSAVITFLNFSFLFCMWFSLINITLTVFSAMSVTLQKKIILQKPTCR